MIIREEEQPLYPTLAFTWMQMSYLLWDCRQFKCLDYSGVVWQFKCLDYSGAVWQFKHAVLNHDYSRGGAATNYILHLHSLRCKCLDYSGVVWQFKHAVLNHEYSLGGAVPLSHMPLGYL